MHGDEKGHKRQRIREFAMSHNVHTRLECLFSALRLNNGVKPSSTSKQCTHVLCLKGFLFFLRFYAK
jgi:hypothetical protein